MSTGSSDFEKTILVTGGAGFIGTNFVDYFAARRMNGDGSLLRGVDGARIFLAVNELNFDEHADKDKYEREQYAGQGNAPYRKSL